ncbi:MAG: PilZ domain-containing protein [Desulfosalsimonadaceae bacterium]|nr:PilZ domain-containing protein [Desulfosalsimonadaceae bacterium]
MIYRNKRRNTRTHTWPDTEATIKVAEAYSDDSRRYIMVKGKVVNLGSNGMFLETDEIVPIDAKAEIIINFDPESTTSALVIRTSGQIVHSTREGIGIRFTSIDLAKLQKCIIGKMNKLESVPNLTVSGN